MQDFAVIPENQQQKVQLHCNVNTKDCSHQLGLSHFLWTEERRPQKSKWHLEVSHMHSNCIVEQGWGMNAIHHPTIHHCQWNPQLHSINISTSQLEKLFACQCRNQQVLPTVLFNLNLLLADITFSLHVQKRRLVVVKRMIFFFFGQNRGNIGKILKFPRHSKIFWEFCYASRNFEELILKFPCSKFFCLTSGCQQRTSKIMRSLLTNTEENGGWVRPSSSKLLPLWHTKTFSKLSWCCEVISMKKECLLLGDFNCRNTRTWFRVSVASETCSSYLHDNNQDTCRQYEPYWPHWNARE